MPAEPNENDLHRKIDEQWSAARSRWSAFEISQQVFIAYVIERLNAERELPVARRASDLYLACGCAYRIPGAVEAFEAAFGETIDRILERLTKDQLLRQEIRQNLLEHLFVASSDRLPKIAEYKGNGDLQAFVRVVATRLALDKLRRVRSHEPEDLLEHFSTDEHDLEFDYLKRVHGEDFKVAFAQALTGLSDRDRTILRYQLLERLSIDQIGAIYDVHRSTVARWAERTREFLLSETYRILQERWKIDPSEVESIIRLLRSQLNVSVQRLLHEMG